MQVSAQPYDRVYNFAAGPAILPVDVLEECQKDMLNWKVCPSDAHMVQCTVSQVLERPCRVLERVSLHATTTLIQLRAVSVFDACRGIHSGQPATAQVVHASLFLNMISGVNNVSFQCTGNRAKTSEWMCLI